MTPLSAILRRRIQAEGPIGVADFMEAALAHPEHGYYRTRDPLGRGGDFTTAPEISQIFGELIGLWCVTVWRMMGAPTAFRLVELGPGRGTLMADLLRAARTVPPFLAAASVHLVETSPALRRRQREALPGVAATWHQRLEEVEDGPALMVANEFFDALPIRQYVRSGGVWRERLVDIDGDGFRFVLGPPAQPDLPQAMRSGDEGAVAEISPAGRAIAARLGARLAAQGGAALIVDYGPAASGLGDSLQAVRGHAFHPVLADPGEADITAHVDFHSLAEAAAPAAALGPIGQGKWLRRLGAELRAEQLVRTSPEKAQDIVSACARLIDPAGMGTLFKVLALSHPGLAALPGFDAA